MKLSRVLLPLMGAASLTLAGCSSAPQVSYVDPNSVDTTTIGYGSTDLQTITQKMVDSMLASPAVVQITGNNQRPTVYFQDIQNRTDQHIDTRQLSNAVSTRLIQSGKFQFLDMSQVQNLKKQLQYQNDSGMVDKATAAKIGKQLGAQYMVYGYITSISQRNTSQQSLYLQVTMSLMNIQTGVIVWQGEKQIRKLEQRSGFSW
jgi:uncharacterized protein (TIGR02722 family)